MRRLDGQQHFCGQEHERLHETRRRRTICGASVGNDSVHKSWVVFLQSSVGKLICSQVEFKPVLAVICFSASVRVTLSCAFVVSQCWARRSLCADGCHRR